MMAEYANTDMHSQHSVNLIITKTSKLEDRKCTGHGHKVCFIFLCLTVV
jgi:hypothetical protein